MSDFYSIHSSIHLFYPLSHNLNILYCFMVTLVNEDVWSLQLIYLPPPWGDCKVTPMDSDFFDSYSITACRIDCETRYLVDNCNCRMVHMPGR